jgi:hypothetical protein
VQVFGLHQPQLGLTIQQARGGLDNTLALEGQSAANHILLRQAKQLLPQLEHRSQRRPGRRLRIRPPSAQPTSPYA